MDDDERGTDAAVFERLRHMWQDVDPHPADLIDRMVAAVAVADLSREYALLDLVEGPQSAAVRSDADTSTLQFSDGRTSVLLHVTATQDGARRIDGWVDGHTLAVRLVQGGRAVAAEPGDHGRFAFDPVPRGLWRLRIVVRGDDGQLREFQTPQFDV